MRTLLFLFLLVPTLASAQLETALWHFGIEKGIDFSSGTPVELTDSKILAREGCASISDCAGNLLFYTNGGGYPPGGSGIDAGTIWNRNNEVMYSMEGVEGGGISAAQSSIIFKKPGNNNAYYLFTMDESEFNSGGSVPGQPQGRGLSYFEIDMDLNGGLGGVAVADQRVFVPSGEGLSACRHDNGEDFWVIIAALETEQLAVFQVTEQGVVDTTLFDPVETSSLGSGQFEFSPDRTKFYGSGNIYDFNSSTGQLSNGQATGTFGYGASFSLNSQYLYTQIPGTGEVVRVEANAPDVAATMSSVGFVNSSFILYSYQLALDSCIYFVFEDEQSASDNSIFRIRDIDGPSPSIEGPIFEYMDDDFAGLPNITDHLFIDGESLFMPDLVEQVDTILCPGEIITLDALNPTANFNWSTGETTQTITVSEPGIYGVDITNDCMQLYAEITINPAPTVAVEITQSQATLCPGENIELTANTTAATIQWSTGESNTPTIVITEPGIYSATAENECGESVTSAPVEIYLLENVPSLEISGYTEAFCEGDSLQLMLSTTNTTNAGWLQAPEQNTLTVEEAGTYTAFAENLCFLIEEEIEVDAISCSNCWEVPNIFTPNRDNVNDAFSPLFDCDVSQYTLIIYNRWGQEVFRTNQVEQAWDGTFLGVPQPTDAYAFRLDIDFKNSNVEDVQITGEINLVR
ncbi:MAG: gliding motility-associated C-terminal domain-containing protein [Bacteroidota bacterium]